MRYVTGGAGLRLAVYESGDPAAPTVLLAHGYPDTHAMWDDVAARLAERFHVVAYDMRGAGASEAPSRRLDYRLPLLAEDLFAVADAVSPDRPVHVVGHDWGSIQAWEAVTAPGAERRIASYTSISGPCLDHVGHWIRERHGRPTPRGARQVLKQYLHSWYVAGFHLPAVAPAVWRHGLAARWRGVLRRIEGVPARPGHPAPTIETDAVNGIELYRANVLQVLLDPRQRHTDIPVQAIQPTRDRYVLPGFLDGLERWAPRLWRRQLAARHWAPLTHSGPLARMVTEFVTHIEGAAATPGLARAAVSDDASAFGGKLAVVTGSGSGIGRATALAFAAEGAEVVVCDIDLDSAEQTAALVRDQGGRAHAYHCDVADEDAVRTLAADVAAAHGVPDILVNGPPETTRTSWQATSGLRRSANAGIGHAGTFLATSVAEWRRVLDVNLWGVIYGCQAFGELMTERGEGGHIVNVSSVAAYLPTKVLTAYATSKAAVFMLSDCLRAELVDHGIGVSTICPGVVNTNITRTSTFSGLSSEEQAAKQAKVSALYARRGFGPEGVAREILRAVRRDRPVVPVNGPPETTRKS